MWSSRACLDTLQRFFSEAQHAQSENKPLITLAWAQSIDGSIARRRGERTTLSGAESLVCTHAMRALHDVVIVGIGTVLADEPRLTVREVSGESPAVAVLDGGARTPPGALLFASGKPVYLFYRRDGSSYESVPDHAVSIPVDADEEGALDLAGVIRELYNRGVRSMMVEGGARVITSFLREGLADLVAVSVTPLLMDGYGVIRASQNRPLVPAAVAVDHVLQPGCDMLVLGRL